MAQRRKVAVVVGSLRKESYSRKLAQACCELAPSLECEIVEIGNLQLYNQDYDDEKRPPAEWTAFRQKIRAADAVLFVTPEYNRSVPGVLKNAIDVGSRPYGQSVWSKKPAAVISNSPGNIGGFGANQHLRQCFVFLDMPILQQPEAYVANVAKLLGEDGKITAAESREFLAKLMQAFAAWIETNSGNGKLDQARAA